MNITDEMVQRAVEGIARDRQAFVDNDMPFPASVQEHDERVARAALTAALGDGEPDTFGFRQKRIDYLEGRLREAGIIEELRKQIAALGDVEPEPLVTWEDRQELHFAVYDFDEIFKSLYQDQTNTATLQGALDLASDRPELTVYRVTIERAAVANATQAKGGAE